MCQVINQIFFQSENGEAKTRLEVLEKRGKIYVDFRGQEYSLEEIRQKMGELGLNEVPPQITEERKSYKKIDPDDYFMSHQDDWDKQKNEKRIRIGNGKEIMVL